MLVLFLNLFYFNTDKISIMNLQLKKAIFAYMCDNSADVQLINTTKRAFEHCSDNKTVSEFIELIYKTVFL